MRDGTFLIIVVIVLTLVVALALQLFPSQPAPILDDRLQNNYNLLMLNNARLQTENQFLQTQITTMKTELASVKAHLAEQKKAADAERLARYQTYYNEYYDYYRYGTTSGRFDLTVVVRDEDGDALENARVTVDDGSSRRRYTDDNGRARFSDLRDDCYDIQVEKDGYESEDRSVCLDHDTTIRFSLDEE